MERKVIHHPEPIGTKEWFWCEKEEADEKKIAYRHWRDWMLEPGEDWILTDDGLVTQVIRYKRYKVSKYSDKDRYYFRTPLGASFVLPHMANQKLKMRGRKGAYDLGGLSKMEKEMSSDLMKNLAMVQAITMNRLKTIEHVLPDANREETRMLLRRMRMEKFRSMVRTELREHLVEAGIDEGKALALLMETIQMAKEKKDVTNMLRAFENMKSLLGMDEKEKTSTTLQITSGGTRKLVDMLNEEEVKMSLTHKVERDVQVEETHEDLGREVVEPEAVEILPD